MGRNKIDLSVLCPHSYPLCHISGDFVLCGKMTLYLLYINLQ